MYQPSSILAYEINISKKIPELFGFNLEKLARNKVCDLIWKKTNEVSTWNKLREELPEILIKKIYIDCVAIKYLTAINRHFTFEEEKERIRFLKFNLGRRIKKAQIDIVNKNYHITFNKNYFSKYVHQF